jgi:DNA-binding response OmpR family regulator
MNGRRLLVVEDDTAIAVPLARALAAEGYDVAVAATGSAALDLALDEPPPDLVLLDLALPDLDGVDLARRLRELLPQAVVLMLTARAAEVDVVLGLDAGADDYVTKPFGLAELLARVRAHLRRGVVDERAAPVVLGRLTVDMGARLCTVDGRPVALRPRELDLLAELVRRAGEAVSRDDLMATVWDEHWHGSTKTLDVHVSSLRRKLVAAGEDPARITTLRGYGYRCEREADPVDAAATGER